jgi:hypothetical protein
VKNQAERKNYQAGAQRRQGGSVQAFRSAKGFALAADLVFVQGNPSELSGIARQSVWGIAGPDLGGEISLQAPQLGGVDLFAASARGRGYPSRHLALTCYDHHVPFGFDSLNILPTDGVSDEWVNNLDESLADLELWANETYPGQHAKAQGRANGGYRVAGFAVNGSSQDHGDFECIDNSCVNESARGSESINFGHSTIVAGLKFLKVKGK